MGRGLGHEPFFATLAKRLGDRSPVRQAAAGLRPSAVLVPLYLREGEPHVVLTRRVDGISHSGQVAFPGGASDATDANPFDTACREAEEELGIPRGLATPLGELDDTLVVTGWCMTPCVAAIPEPGTDAFQLRPNPGEVARVFHASLAALADPARTPFRFEPRTYLGQTFEIPFFLHDGEVIWGATGRVLLQLLELALGFVAPQ